MNIHIDVGVRKNCWNLMDSYGMICVHCGCCSRDRLKRYKARIKCLEQWYKDNENFKNWADDPDLRQIQEKNIKANRLYLRRKLRYYRKKITEMETKAGPER